MAKETCAQKGPSYPGCPEKAGTQQPSFTQAPQIPVEDETDRSYEGRILSCVCGWSSGYEVLTDNILTYAQPFYTLSRVRFGDFISKQPMFWVSKGFS